jgi:methane/ammonia monooxygenase subunit B
MKLLKDRIAQWSMVGLLTAFAATSFYAPNAAAHGEKSQAAFMRMRTIHWYDLHWSKEKVKVNDFVEITGKFHVFEGWPETVDEPDVAFLNIGIPGPVFIRKESYIGGQLVPRSVRLEIGKTYEFKVVLKARRPGDWHVHTMMNVQGGGPIIGPGKWITIEGSMGDFKNPLTSLTGQTFDLETYNLENTYFWHACGTPWAWPGSCTGCAVRCSCPAS